MKNLLVSALLGLTVSAQLFATSPIQFVKVGDAAKTFVDIAPINDLVMISIKTEAGKKLEATVSEDTGLGGEEVVCAVSAIFYEPTTSETKVLVAYDIGATDSDAASCLLTLSGSALEAPKDVTLQTIFE